MSREARSFAVVEYTASPYVYKDADTYVALVAMLQQVMSTRVSQAALVMVTLSYDQDLKPAQALQNDRSTISILQYLRSLVRKTDYVVRLASTCYFLLPGADEHGGQIVQTRLWEALLWRTHSASEGEIIRPRGMAIGHSSYPTPCLTVEALLEKASD